VTFVRRDVWSLPPGDTTVSDYAKGVAAMMARPATDPTSWSFQAAIHGTYTTPANPLWNQCEHASWYFPPWHRMYLWYFEQIVRAAIVSAGGSADWALPYWNYGAGGQDATLPLGFRQASVNGAANPLYTVKRATGVNAGTLAIPPAVGVPSQALACPSFTGITQFGGGDDGPAQFASSTGVLENTPHNQVHVLVGGPGGLMYDPDTAAQDPIFWLHHANIDRIWDQWNRAVPTHTDPADQRWLTQSFSFYDASGAQVSLKCSDVLNIVNQLNYSYAPPPARPIPWPFGPPRWHLDSVMAEPPEGAQPPTEPTPAPEPELVVASSEPVRLSGQPEQVSFTIDQAAAQSALAELRITEPNHVYLMVQDTVGDADPGTVYGIYVNLPADATAEIADAHHAGNIAFFGIARAQNPRGDAHPHSLNVSHDITALTRALAADREWDGQHVTITFRPIGLVPPDHPELTHQLPPEPPAPQPPITVGRVAIYYA